MRGRQVAGAGTMRIDGTVTTGILGTDAEWDRLLARVTVSASEGESTFDHNRPRTAPRGASIPLLIGTSVARRSAR